MKIIVTILVLMISSYCLSQTDVELGESSNFKLQYVGLSMTIDSAQDLESLNMESLISIFDQVAPNEDISVELKCKGKPMSNGELSSFSMKMGINIDQKNEFPKLVRKLKKAAQTFYNIK